MRNINYRILVFLCRERLLRRHQLKPLVLSDEFEFSLSINSLVWVQRIYVKIQFLLECSPLPRNYGLGCHSLLVYMPSGD